MDERRAIRVFVSSPSDVRPERLVAERVVRRLAREFAYHFRLDTVLWEREPLLASHDFQALITPPRETDIVVVLLWSRLGVPLPEASYAGPLSGRPVTGTEWEFEDALASYRARQLPDLLVYRKQAEISVRLGDRAVLEEQQRQAELVDEFMRRWFYSADGKSFTAAFWQFDDAAAFEDMLADHLRALLRKRVEQSATGAEAPAGISWHEGSPFRGLQTFELEHAPVFFGRTRARNDLRELLGRQIMRGSAFVLVIGASGSGKSSLVKAGLLPDLLLPGMIGRVALCRHAITRPATSGAGAPADPIGGLARALLADTALAELSAAPFGYDAERLTRLLERTPDEAGRVIAQALAVAGQKAALTAIGEARLVLIVDQLEELFTAKGVDQAQRERFVLALAELASSGVVWVIATLRSDFFDRLESLPLLVKLASGEAKYLLAPPDAAEIAQIIRQPAREAGLSFEADPRNGLTLDEIMRAAAARDAASLPLLEYLLDQLWQRRTERGLLTLAAYDALGGLEGAIGRRAEEVLLAQPASVQAAFPAVLRALVTVAQGEQAAATARMAPLASFAAEADGAALVQALLDPAARILVADMDGDTARVRVAHEALLTHWPRARQQIEADRRDLQIRGRLEEAAGQWHRGGREASLLIPRGVRLSEAEDFLTRRKSEIDPLCAAYIAESRRRVAWRRGSAIAAVAAASILLGIAGTVAHNFWRQWHAVELEREAARNRTDIQGSLIAYSTQPGSVASDGPGRNGLYTEQLLKFLGARELNIAQVFTNTHKRMHAAAQNASQIPEIRNSLTGDIYLLDPPPSRKIVGLVIGNGTYRYLTPLNNPVHDAEDIHATLSSAGLQTRLLVNQTRRQVLTAVSELIDQVDRMMAGAPSASTAPPAGATRGLSLPDGRPPSTKHQNVVVFLYLSGQGVEIGGRPYFATVDSDGSDQEMYLRTSIDVNALVERLSARTAVQILIMDFCRDNPWDASPQAKAGR